MKFLTDEECKEWMLGTGNGALIEKRPAETDSKFQLGGRIPTVPRLVPFCRCLESVLQPYDDLLVWVTVSGVWPSSEPWHLYYRLRQSYFDHRLLEEAPGHLFMAHESEDARSLIQIGLIAGWDMHLVPNQGFGQAYISHDEFWEASFDSPETFKSAREALKTF